MGLFEVPGWSVPSGSPVSESSPSPSSKKRKRGSLDSFDSRFKTAEANLDKLMQKFRGSSSSETSGPSTSKTSPKSGSVLKTALSKHEERKKEKKSQAHEEKKKLISHPRPLKPSTPASKTQHQRPKHHHRQNSDASTTASLVPSPPKKKLKTDHDVSQKTVKFALDVSDDNRGLTKLQKEMQQSLGGARFRMINESLYKHDSKTSHEMMRKDPQMFEEYHSGFRHQVHSWPTNPVETYISTFSLLPKGTLIVDLGCGDAALAKALVPLGLSVLSYDLVSDGAFVVEADICSSIPLPGSEGPEGELSEGNAHVADAAVCALSLMGTNWPKTIREAWRILKPDGELKVAEVASRFTDIDAFVELIETIGFRLQSKDDSNSHFTLFDFVKVARYSKTETEWKDLEARGALLKPCEYKRR